MKEAALTFIQKVQADTALSQQVAQLGQDTMGIVQLASIRGYQFDEATFIEALNGMFDRELSDEELEQVSGGGDGSWSGYWTWNSSSGTWTWTWVWHPSSSGWISS